MRYYLASSADLPIEPESKEDIEQTIGIDTSEAQLVSAKTGLGVESLLDQIIEKLPLQTQMKII